MALSRGTKLGRYEIEFALGAGGMGEVYLARDPLLGRDVAIKLLRAAHATDPERLRRFEQEARATAALNHPHILAIHDIGRDGETPFIVTEYLRGESLADYLRRERPSCARALEMGIEVADALSVAHRAGIVHRDLKPANVMLMPDGHIKVLDFGLAKFFALETAAPTTVDVPIIPHTRVGQLLGTPGYMSPEQLLGYTVDHRTDIYSLGVILFELVTGQRPFEGDDPHFPHQTALTAQIRTAREADPSVPSMVSDLIARAMARSPSDRFQTADQFRRELKGLLDTVDFDPSPGATVRDANRRRRSAARSAAWLVGVAILTGAAAIPVVRWWRAQLSVAVARPVIAVLPFTNLTGDDSKAYLGFGIADMLTTNLARLSAVSVVSRSTMQESRAQPTADLRAIARELGVTMLLRGSIQQSGTRLRVTTTLVTPEGRVLWSGDAEAGFSELFTIENRLADSLLASLSITVSDEERRRLSRPPTGDLEALEAYWRGLALMDRPDDVNLETAVANLKRAVTRDPRFSLAFAALGEVYRRRSVRANEPGLMSQAAEAVSEALRIDPDQPAVRLSLARLYRSTGRSAAAVEEVKRVITSQPDNDDAHRLLGELLAREGRLDEALAAFQRAVSIRPQYWLNQESLGLFYYQRGQLKEAVATFSRITELKPDDATPFQQLGSMYLAMGDRVRARQNFERSIKIRPNSSAYTNLGMIFYSEKQYPEAAHACEEAVRLAPGRPVLRRNLGDAYQKLGRTADAKAAYEKAVDLAEEALTVNPSDATLASQLGVYYAKAGKPREAERYASRAVAFNPTSPEVGYRRAVVLALIGRPDAAVQQLSAAITQGYAIRLALEDDDLVSLRSMPAFQKLAASAASK